jgi:GNAT superfamily N-acetyltransferase
MEGASASSVATSAYTIREYDPADEPGFCRLFEQVFGHSVNEAWFDWKYRSNPYFDGVPIVIAETNERVIGARPFFTLPVRVGDRVLTGFQPGDTMVHPEHRRQGLFNRMTEHALDWLDSLDQEIFCFNFPNENSRPGYLKLGWREVGSVPTWYRIENPGALLSNAEGLPGRLATVAGQGYLAARDTVSASTSDDVSIECRADPPASTLASLYDKDVPDRFHAHRTPSFYEWRLAAPQWTYRTYLASRAGDPVVGAVVGTGTRDGIAVAQIIDAVPLSIPADETDLYRQLLSAIVADIDADTDVVAATATGLPGAVLSSHGFHRDDRLPLSAACTPTTLVARPTDSGGWLVADRHLAALGEWCLSLIEQDTR